jgi:DNA-binding transcriptional ArsR family regulator
MRDDADRVSDAFAALGSETRVDILQALVDARREHPRDSGVSFSELRERVGVEDSGRFNYHLGKLRDWYVEETDGVYELTYAGKEVVGAILAGTHDPALVLEPETLADPCPLCCADMTAYYEYGQLRVECENEHTPIQTTVPPAAALDRSVTELLSVATLATYARLELATGGICYRCYGRVDARIDAHEFEGDTEYLYRTLCARCGSTSSSLATVVLVRHPAFVSLCRDHGVDLRERVPWTIPGLVDGEVTKTSEDPPVYGVRVELGDEALEATLDDTGTVRTAERVAVDAGGSSDGRA